MEITSFEATVITGCRCRQELCPGLISTSRNSSFDQQSMGPIAGSAGSDYGQLNSTSERQAESRVGSEEILPPKTSFSGLQTEPQVAHAFYLAHS